MNPVPPVTKNFMRNLVSGDADKKGFIHNTVKSKHSISLSLSLGKTQDIPSLGPLMGLNHNILFYHYPSRPPFLQIINLEAIKVFQGSLIDNDEMNMAGA